MTTVQIAVLASGGGTNLQALLDGNLAPGRIAAVGSDRIHSGALDRARLCDIPTFVVGDNGRDADGLLAYLKAYETQLLVLAGYLKLVPKQVVETYGGRILNIHPALLPGFGGQGMYGRRVHEAVLATGARVTGPTIHLVDEHYDRGTIIAQWPVPVLSGDTPDTLQARVLEAEHALFPAVVRRAADRIAQGLPIVAMDIGTPHFGEATVPECDHAIQAR